MTSVRRSASRNLIDHVAGPAEHGPPLALLATTFDLTPDFVETDYLPTLLRLPAWNDRQIRAHVQLETELARMDAVVMLMEARRYQGRPRSLRLHVTPKSLASGGVLHAKVSLIVHEEAVRLIVASANLTTPGYRSNREVALSLSAGPKRREEGALIQQALAAMPKILSPWWGDAAARVTAAARDRLAAWGIEQATSDEWFAWSGPGTPLLRQLARAWPPGEAVTRIRIVSPFWCEADDDGLFAQLLNVLRESGAKTDGAQLDLVTCAGPDTTKTYRPVLPASYATFDFRRLGLAATATPIKPQVDPEDVGRDDILRERALHAKVLLIEGRTTTVGYVGSANFTVPGWGFGNPAWANVEAGVILRRQGKNRSVLDALVPPTIGNPTPLEGGGTAVLGVPEPSAGDVSWAAFVASAELRPSALNPSELVELSVRLGERDLPTGWSLALEPEGAPCFEGVAEPNAEHVFPLDEKSVRTLMRNQAVFLRWQGMNGTEPVAFPINVSLSAREKLPFGDPDALPREHDLVAFYQGRIAMEDLFPDPESEPSGDGSSSGRAEASGVDTSKILSYQVRSFVEALPGIRDELVRNVSTASAIRLALLGPVSPVALAREIEKAARQGRSATASAFQLVELLRCLNDARRCTVAERVRTAWAGAVDEASSEIEQALARIRTNETVGPKTGFARYADAVLRGPKGRRAP